jgi:cysteine desulfurase
MLPFFEDQFGNPSSIHMFGQQGEAAIEGARASLAHHMNCRPDEIIFTSCGTESDNLALRGAAMAARQEREAKHLLISPVEHHAVSYTALQLEKNYGFELEFLPVDEHGQVHPEEVEKHLRPDTALVSVMYANNEIGSVNPIGEIGRICRERGIVFHTDAVQAPAYLPIDTKKLNVDLMSLGAHKFYGPKGTGVLYVRKGTPLLPAQTGGGQEYGLRAGTQNVPYIVGMAEAFKIAQTEQEQHNKAITPLRDHIIGQVLEEVPDSRLTGHPTERLSNHASFVFRGVDGNELLMMLDVAGFACSSGSACKTGNPEPSDVLSALNLSPNWALGSLRVTLGRNTSAEDVNKFAAVLPGIVAQARALEKPRK